MTIIKQAALCIVLVASSSYAQAPDWTRAQPVSIEMSSFRYRPNAIRLHHGTAYRLHLANASSGGHDFAAKEFFANSIIAPQDADKIRDGGIDVAGEEATDVSLTPMKPGTYKVHCSHFMHSTFGMTASVIVD